MCRAEKVCDATLRRISIQLLDWCVGAENTINLTFYPVDRRFCSPSDTASQIFRTMILCSLSNSFCLLIASICVLYEYCTLFHHLQAIHIWGHVVVPLMILIEELPHLFCLGFTRRDGAWETESCCLRIYTLCGQSVLSVRCKGERRPCYYLKGILN